MHVPVILKALASLDPKDDGHWTSDGAPRLDVLENVLPGVTREMLRRAAPLFNRKHTDLPDLEAERAAAEEAMREAKDAEDAAAAAKRKAESAKAIVLQHEQQIRDRHTLTRDNQAWVRSQLAEDLKRAARQREIDQAIGAAGGLARAGQHPVERNMAARNKAARRDIIVPVQKKATP